MDAADVTPQQAATIAGWLTPTMLRLAKLKERMEAQQFPPNDPLYAKAVAAHEAVRVFRLALHDIERRGV